MRSPTSAELPTLPRLKLSAVEQLIDLLTGVFGQYHDRLLDVPFARQLGASASAVIGHKVPESNVRNTLAQYAGERLTIKIIERLAYQLGARTTDLQAGPLLRVGRQTGTGWHLVEIYGMTPEQKQDKHGQQTTFFCRTGQLAGYRLTHWLSDRHLSWLAYEALGFSPRLPYDPNAQWMLLGLRAWVYLAEQEEQLQFVHWVDDARSRKRNQGMLKRRLRFDIDLDRVKEEREAEYSCPRNYDHYCSACHVHPKVCAASIHRDPLAQPTAVDHQPGGDRVG